MSKFAHLAVEHLCTNKKFKHLTLLLSFHRALSKKTYRVLSKK